MIDLEQLAQDGLRVRAAAGAASFRRRARLERHLDDARPLVARLGRELHHDAGASNRRLRAARERAAREKEARMEELEAERKRREKTDKKKVEKQKKPRASTTERRPN